MSYGGVMTSLALARYPQDFAVGVDMAGVHDWRSFLPELTAPGASARSRRGGVPVIGDGHDQELASPRAARSWR